MYGAWKLILDVGFENRVGDCWSEEVAVEQTIGTTAVLDDILVLLLLLLVLLVVVPSRPLNCLTYCNVYGCGDYFELSV